MTETPPPPWPVELRLLAARDGLAIAFEDGTRSILEAVRLREHSPSAENRPAAGRAKTPAKPGIKITGLEPVGRYAVRILFDDGHATGLYSWQLLHRLAVGG